MLVPSYSCQQKKKYFSISSSFFFSIFESNESGILVFPNNFRILFENFCDFKQFSLHKSCPQDQIFCNSNKSCCVNVEIVTIVQSTTMSNKVNFSQTSFDPSTFSFIFCVIFFNFIAQKLVRFLFIYSVERFKVKGL